MMVVFSVVSGTSGAAGCKVSWSEVPLLVATPRLKVALLEGMSRANSALAVLRSFVCSDFAFRLGRSCLFLLTHGWLSNLRALSKRLRQPGQITTPLSMYLSVADHSAQDLGIIRFKECRCRDLISVYVWRSLQLGKGHESLVCL